MHISEDANYGGYYKPKQIIEMNTQIMSIYIDKLYKTLEIEDRNNYKGFVKVFFLRIRISNLSL